MARRRWLLAAGALAALPACGEAQRVEGSGRPAEQTRAPGPFRAVELQAPIDVQLRPAAEERITLRGDDHVLPLIETRLEAERLVIGLRSGAAFRTRRPPAAVVEFRRLERVTIRGAGDVHAERIAAPLFAAEVFGAGDLTIDTFEGGTFALVVAGSGDVRVRGRAQTVGIVIEGSGDVRAADLAAQEVAVRIAGSGDAQVHASQRLEVHIAGSGDVLYRGTPRIEQRVRGSGEVRPLR